MLHLEEIVQLKQDEEVQCIIRRHGATLIPQLFFAFILIVVPFFMMFPLFSWGVAGIAVFALAVCFGIVIALRTFILWDADALIVTNVRIVDVDQRGVFSRFVTEIALHSIQDISWQRKGVFETVCGIGTLTIQGVLTQPPLCVVRIARPERVQEQIHSLKEKLNAVVSHKDVSEQQARERSKILKEIIQMLEGYSIDELKRVDVVLQARTRGVAADAFFSGDASSKS